tara:strand:- start:18 stop:194 length:177 start_codon:yes stop_codon:yes gene_type:complete
LELLGTSETAKESSTLKRLKVLLQRSVQLSMPFAKRVDLIVRKWFSLVFPKDAQWLLP